MYGRLACVLVNMAKEDCVMPPGKFKVPFLGKKW